MGWWKGEMIQCRVRDQFLICFIVLELQITDRPWPWLQAQHDDRYCCLRLLSSSIESVLKHVS